MTDNALWHNLIIFGGGFMIGGMFGVLLAGLCAVASDADMQSEWLARRDGYQPTASDLDDDNLPRGGSGLSRSRCDREGMMGRPGGSWMVDEVNNGRRVVAMPVVKGEKGRGE